MEGRFSDKTDKELSDLRANYLSLVNSVQGATGAMIVEALGEIDEEIDARLKKLPVVCSYCGQTLAGEKPYQEHLVKVDRIDPVTGKQMLGCPEMNRRK